MLPICPKQTKYTDTTYFPQTKQGLLEHIDNKNKCFCSGLRKSSSRLTNILFRTEETGKPILDINPAVLLGPYVPENIFICLSFSPVNAICLWFYDFVSVSTVALGNDK